MDSWHARLVAWLASPEVERETRAQRAAHAQHGLTPAEARLCLQLTTTLHAALLAEAREDVTFARSPVGLVRNVLAPQLERDAPLAQKQSLERMARAIGCARQAMYTLEFDDLQSFTALFIAEAVCDLEMQALGEEDEAAANDPTTDHLMWDVLECVEDKVHDARQAGDLAAIDAWLASELVVDKPVLERMFALECSE